MIQVPGDTSNCTSIESLFVYTKSSLLPFLILSYGIIIVQKLLRSDVKKVRRLKTIALVENVILKVRCRIPFETGIVTE